MDFLNIKNVHDNSLAQLKVGLAKATSFILKNTGSAITIADDANSVNKLVVGGSSGFTISLNGSYITFSANSGSSPLAIKEPGKGGITGCPFYYSHQDKYSGGRSASSIGKDDSCDELKVDIKNDMDSSIPNASNYPDNSILVSQNGKWTAIEYDELLETLKNDLGIK